MEKTNKTVEGISVEDLAPEAEAYYDRVMELRNELVALESEMIKKDTIYNDYRAQLKKLVDDYNKQKAMTEKVESEGTKSE